MRLPDEPVTGPRQKWVTGQCWRCDGTGLQVLWLGPALSEVHGYAPLYACEPCTRRLEELISAYNARRDIT
ncbi:hypothetical protein GCM10017667_01650 [Streptomyces filamentosus]|uniref:Uncharacterized protein n=1 Tax=Streptomyces filamentosus TaxID=67294 RepID=A0A919BBT6_STRFL|nr:hypothetical protein GCM10017667_01650 [Streptomyces filamentosus]